MENICSKSYFPAGIYRFKVKLAKSRFDDITYVCVNSVFCSMSLVLISACVRFRQIFCYIVLRTLIYYFIFSLNLVCLELREGLYYFILTANLCFFSLITHSTLLRFFIFHGEILYCCYIACDRKACSIFDIYNI